ncbi:MAG: glycosyltransferase family 4 protein [Planctomycetes bacterium]|nr:glycosyltransferase family 4 protein [Planctomycetota bacterium]
MSLHVAVAGWLLGAPSGANRRLLGLLGHLGPLLRPDEQVTLLHRADTQSPVLPGIRCVPVAIPGASTWSRLRAERRVLPSLLRALDAGVFDHGFLLPPPVPMPTCLTLHDVRAADGQTRWPRWLGRALVRHAAARAAAIVVPSEFTAGRVRALVGPRARVHVVPNGVDLPPLAQPTREPGQHLLHVGHLEPRKHLELLLHALALLPADARPSLVLVGQDAGSWRPLARTAARLGVAVDWRGPLADAAVAPLLATARAVVVPSRYEGFGLLALEGLAHGRPVLVASAGALPEVVGNAGVVLPDEPKAWAQAIAATATLACPSASAARRRRAAAFAWPAAAESLLQVWRRLGRS